MDVVAHSIEEYIYSLTHTLSRAIVKRYIIIVNESDLMD